MAAHQLVADAARDVVQSEPALLLGDLGLQVHLQQQIAQFLAQIGVGDVGVVGARLDRLDDLGGLLDQMLGEAAVRLFRIPGALPPDATDDLPQTCELVVTRPGLLARGAGQDATSDSEPEPDGPSWFQSHVP
ncbi:hypothetical protein GCM10009785_15740 [Brooklawnia cerclae]